VGYWQIGVLSFVVAVNVGVAIYESFIEIKQKARKKRHRVAVNKLLKK